MRNRLLYSALLLSLISVPAYADGVSGQGNAVVLGLPTTGDLLKSGGGVIILDSGVSVSGLPSLSGSNTWTGSNTFANVTHFNSELFLPNGSYIDSTGNLLVTGAATFDGTTVTFNSTYTTFENPPFADQFNGINDTLPWLLYGDDTYAGDPGYGHVQIGDISGHLNGILIDVSNYNEQITLTAGTTAVSADLNVGGYSLFNNPVTIPSTLNVGNIYDAESGSNLFQMNDGSGNFYGVIGNSYSVAVQGSTYFQVPNGAFVVSDNEGSSVGDPYFIVQSNGSTAQIGINTYPWFYTVNLGNDAYGAGASIGSQYYGNNNFISIDPGSGSLFTGINPGDMVFNNTTSMFYFTNQASGNGDAYLSSGTNSSRDTNLFLQSGTGAGTIILGQNSDNVVVKNVLSWGQYGQSYLNGDGILWLGQPSGVGVIGTGVLKANAGEVVLATAGTDYLVGVYTKDANYSASVSSTTMLTTSNADHTYELFFGLMGLNGTGTRTAACTYTYYNANGVSTTGTLPTFAITANTSYTLSAGTANPTTTPAMLMTAGAHPITWACTYGGSGTGSYQVRIFLTQLQ